MFSSPFAFILLSAFSHHSHAAYYYPSPLFSRLEHILVDTDGYFRSGFKDAINPCSNYVSGSQNVGRQTSAQWLRVAFHDFVTARVEEGTGGMDASISMETLRDEDSGSAFNDTFSFFQPYIDTQTSAADLLSLSVVLALSNCGGLMVPLRGGRIDAHQPGAFGVPAPETNLTETLEFFANAGFNAQDSIGLTACGHSMGRIHHGGFPQVVPESAVTPNNTAGGVDLDTTPANFDDNIVKEYLGNYGQKGGPLVTSDNVTVRSDLRLYESDGNTTMKTLGQSKDHFADVCKGLFERMINTIPKNVVLSETVTPVSVKPMNTTFDLNKDGNIVLRGAIRILKSDPSAAPRTIEISLSGPNSSSNTIATATALPETGYSIYGNTSFYQYSSTSLQQSYYSSPLALTITGSSIPKTTFNLDPSLFFVPSLSTLDSNILRIVAASTSNATGPTAKVSYPVTQVGLNTLVPAIKTEALPMQIWSTNTGNGYYTLFKAEWQAPNEINWTSSSVDIQSEGVKDEYNRLGYLVS